MAPVGHFYMVFNVYDNKVTRGKEEHMSPYIEFPLIVKRDTVKCEIPE